MHAVCNNKFLENGMLETIPADPRRVVVCYKRNYVHEVLFLTYFLTVVDVKHQASLPLPDALG